MKLRFENNEEKTIYELGVVAGINSIMNKIELHYKQKKPIMANGKLYFLRSDMDNLNDILNHLGKN